MRNPTDTVQINLRIKERERAQLAAAAEANGVSLNAEMTTRLARSLQQVKEWEAGELARDVSRYLGPLVADVRELNMRGDLMRAADVMAALLAADSPPPRDEVEGAIDRYSKVKRMIELETGIRIRVTRAPGAQS